MLSTDLSMLSSARVPSFLRRICGGIALAVLCFASPAHADLDSAMAGSDVIKVTMGKAEIVKLSGDIADIMVADPKIVDVSALQSDKLYLVGASLGDTNIIALDAEGNVLRKLDVHVRIDTASIQNLIHELFPHEKNVVVHTVGNQVALTGSVSTPSAATKIAKLVAAHMSDVRAGGSAANVDSMIENLLEVRGQQQVTLRVRIMEISRDVLKELGIETATGNATSSNGFRPKVTITDGIGLTKDSFAVTSMLFDSGFGTIGDILLKLNALETDGLASVLAEPNLTAVSGEEAGFLAGGEFPVPTGRDQNGNIVITYKQFGVSLNFKPIVMSEDRISLQLKTEVSSLDQAKGITLSELTVPGIDVRRASTTVEMNSGGSIMMAGLMKSNNIKGMSGLPGIKDTPVLGALVSSKSFQRQETELVVIVTPYLVQPFADKTQAKPVFEGQKLLPPPPPTAAMRPEDKGKPEALYTQNEAEDLAAEQDMPIVQLDTAPMTKIFSSNMKKIYGNRLRNLPADKQVFGYMID